MDNGDVDLKLFVKEMEKEVALSIYYRKMHRHLVNKISIRVFAMEGTLTVIFSLVMSEMLLSQFLSWSYQPISSYQIPLLHLGIYDNTTLVISIL